MNAFSNGDRAPQFWSHVRDLRKSVHWDLHFISPFGYWHGLDENIVVAGLSTPSTVISRLPRRSERVQQEARNALALLGVQTPLEVSRQNSGEVES